VGLGSVEAEEGVTPAWLEAGRFEIEIAGRRHAARPSLRPLYDPKGSRIRV
jgi:4-methylaminobutanoate oxidase (formaldehyde-forming)